MSDIILNALPLAAQYGPRGDGWGWHLMGGWGMGPMGGIMMFAVWGLIIVGGIFTIRWLIQASRDAGQVGGDGALEILRQRYARGEIDGEQFKRMKGELGVR